MEGWQACERRPADGGGATKGSVGHIREGRQAAAAAEEGTVHVPTSHSQLEATQKRRNELKMHEE